MSRKPSYEELEQRVRELEKFESTHKQEELRKNELIYKIIIENSHEGILIVQNGKIVFANPRIYDFLSYSEEELTNQAFLNLIHPYDKDWIIEQYTKKVKGEDVPVGQSYRIINSKGGTFWVQSRSSLIEWQGRPAILSFLIDVTQLINSEKALRDSEKKFREIVEISRDIYYRQDFKTATLDYMSPAVTRILGYSIDEIMNMDLEQQNKLFHPEDLPGLLSFRDDLIDADKKGNNFIEREFRMIDKYGGVHWINGNYVLTKKENNEPKFILGVLKDITKTKQDEELLREREAKFRSIFENKGTATGIFGEDSIIIGCNTVFEELSGYIKSEILDKKKWSDFVVKEDLERMQRYHAQRSKNRESLPSQYECRIVNKQGEIKTVIVNISVVGFDRVVSLIDITDRKKAEEELLKSEERYRQLIENAVEAIFVVQDGKLVFSNPKTEELIGYSKEEIESRAFTEFIHPYDQVMVAERHIQRLKGEKLPSIYDFRVIRKSGEVRWVDLNVVLIEWEGRPATLNFLSDITDQKRTEEEIRKNLISLSQAETMAQLGYFERNWLTEEGYWSKGFYNLLGYAPGDIPCTNEEFFRHIHPGDKERVLDHIEQSISNRTKIDIDFRIVQKSKNIIHIHGVGETIYQGDTPQITRGTFQNISHRINTEEKLKESEEKYRLLAETTQDIIILHDMEGHLSYINQAGLEFSGYKASEAIGSPIFEFIPHEHQGKLADRRSRRSAGDKQTLRYEIEFLNQEGERVPFEVNSTPVMHENRVSEVLVVARDITERKRAEEALRKSEEKFAFLFRASPIWIALNEMSSGKYLEVNQAFEKITGFQREEVIGKTSIELGLWPNPEDRERSIAMLENKDSLYDYEVRFRMRNGEYRDFLWSVEKIQLNGLDCTVNVLRDITEEKAAEIVKKNLETQLRQAQKLEAIGTLAGGIAHDFNNILAALLGYTELALLDVSKGTPLEENLEEIRNSGFRARDLVQQILAFSRKSEEKRRPIKVTSIIKEALRMLRASIPTIIEIRQKLDAKNDIVNADPTQIHQIMMNLCTNAAQSMKDGGILEINLNEIMLHSEFTLSHSKLDPGAYLKLTVSDTGEGIPLELMNRIFDPYFTTKEKGSGTGLGLAVVHGIVTSLDGNINVKSELEKGTVFEIYLPKFNADYIEKDDIEDFIMTTGSERILFVDDEKSIINVVGKMLKRLDYKVTPCTGSKEALSKFQENPNAFDLVITDMTMPNMTGDQLARELLKIRPDIPIILCTGYSERITEEEAKDMGIKAFVMKPLSLKDIARTIRNVLDEDEEDNTNF